MGFKAALLFLALPLSVWAKDVSPCPGILEKWTAHQGRLADPAKEREEAERLYCHWKAGLTHTFLSEYVAAASHKHPPTATLWTALDRELEPAIEDFLEKNGVVFSTEEERLISRLPASSINVRLKAWSSLRKGLNARDAMNGLPAGHRWRAPLSKTVTLALARLGRNAEAMSLLRKEMDDAAALPFDKEAASIYALQYARFQYQAGDIDEAAKWYDLVPMGTDEYVPAREELLWIWLRKGDQERLRGTVETLALPAFESKLVPEVYAVRAISNLKLCHYEEAQKDFEAFMAVNARWVKPMEAAAKVAEPARPPEVDWYGRLLDRGLASASAEGALLAEIKGEPLKGAALALSAHERRLTELRSNEYRRQWKNAAASLREAIIKMRFVKVELIRQLDERERDLASGETSLARENQDRAHSSVMTALKDNELTFPYDGVLWQDEMFRLRSDASNRCL